MSKKDQVMSKRSLVGIPSEQLKPCKKKMKGCVEATHRLTINPRYLQDELVEYLRREFTSASAAATTLLPDRGTNTTTTNNNNNNISTSTTTTNNNISTEHSRHLSSTCEKLVDASPFVHCVLPEFITEDHSLDTLQGELQEVTFNEKNNDLYNFHQSFDLAQHTSPQITAFRQLFYTDVLEWMKKVTNIELTDVVDLFCSIYEYTDVLLCHDDQLEGRRIAFILYLVPPWGATDGGTLDLFTANEVCQPTNVAKSVLPAWNQLTFFEVSPRSFHQVSEVLSKEKTRLSVSGWFHGPNLPRIHVVAQPSKLPLCPSLESETDLLFDWVNPSYLDLEVQSEIREKFELESEIQLQDFLKPDKYSAVNDAFLQSDIEWIHRGPANQRNYYVANTGTFPNIIVECLRFLQSEIMFLFLSNLTGLKLHKDATVSDDDDDGGRDDDDGDDGDGGVDNGKEDGNDKDNDCDVRTAATRSSQVSAGDTKSHGRFRKESGKPSRSGEEVSQVGPNDCSSSSSSSHPAAGQQQSTKVTNAADTSKPSPPGATDGDTATGKGQSQKCPSSSSEASCSQEIRMWSHGSYTLLRDTEAKSADYALDTFLFFGCEGWQPDYGGYISYIVNGEDEELLTVSPSHNSLALVYRDSETLRFVKHINHRITSMPNQKFFDISFIYYE